MDTSEQYIKMVDCPEIQGARPAMPWSEREFYTYYKGGDVLVWLPRQDQLQILSGLSWQEFDKECLKYDAETKEQAGIQVVIKILDKTT